jgi:hypothetical protein
LESKAEVGSERPVAARSNHLRASAASPSCA